MSAPIPFDGSPEEAKYNFNTHQWQTFDPSEPPVCGACDSKMWHVAADYPCGEEPPRSDDPEVLEQWFVRLPVSTIPALKEAF